MCAKDYAITIQQTIRKPSVDFDAGCDLSYIALLDLQHVLRTGLAGPGASGQELTRVQGKSTAVKF